MPPTSPPGSAEPVLGDATGRRAGFVLMEIIPALVILGLVALLAFPAIPRGTSAPRLAAMAVETAALVRDARSAALASGRETAAFVDARARRLDFGGRGLFVPADVDLSVLAGGTCPTEGGRVAIRFRPDGTACGAVIRFARGGRGIGVRINWATGNVAIVEGA
jgi:general secretion pathway protein H